MTAEDVGPHEVKREPSPVIMGVNDAVGLAGVAAPKVAEELHLGPAGAIVSIVNDPSKKNVINTGLGLAAGSGGAIMGAFTDFLDYGINNSNPGPQKAYNSDQLTPMLPSQDQCPPGMGPC